MKCKVCDKRVKEGKAYCEHHAKAYENVVDKYDSWNKALGVTWKVYLDEIIKNPLTGSWAKEVAQQLLEENSISGINSN
ncbi:MAG: hypothetical protein ACQXXH_06745 [Candidatus Bathyarchaeia archaeon]|jgi:hypothetical protein|nr:hypothetical protein [Candidatus Bathyarchaeota archaeon A05DMB-4]MDH7595803.1 hypothetical protein [Candidatus Bathyarchaeota archaeon]